MKKKILYIVLSVILIAFILITTTPLMDSPRGTGLRVKPQFMSLYTFIMVIVVLAGLVYFWFKKRK